jgi:hypothetical protein
MLRFQHRVLQQYVVGGVVENDLECGYSVGFVSFDRVGDGPRDQARRLDDWRDA